MQKILKKVFIPMGIAAMITCAAVGCAAKENSGASKAAALAALNQQVRTVEDGYNDLYAKSKNAGGFFNIGSTTNIPAAYRGGKVSGEAADTVKEEVTFEEVQSVVSRNQKDSYSKFIRDQSYISDIFVYSQIQLALTEQYKTEALLDDYDLVYKEANGEEKSGIPSYILSFMKQTRPFRATVTGADEETGRLYFTQSHHFSQNGNEVFAEVEYFHNSDQDMGTVTINYHSNNQFELHYINYSLGFYMLGTGTHTDRVLNEFGVSYIRTLEGQLIPSRLSDENDEKIIENFALGEIGRIEGKIKALTEENLKNAEIVGKESAEESAEDQDDFTEAEDVRESKKTCSVTLDYKILKEMLG